MISGSATTQPGGANYTAGTWTNKDAAVSFSCLDSGGAIDQNTVAGGTLTTSGADQSVTNTGTCTDKASNVANSVTFSNIDIDRAAPTVNPASVTNNAWRNTSLSQIFASSNGGSGLADAGDASFTLTASAESINAGNPTVVSKTVSDLAGNSTTRTVSAKIDLTDPTFSASLDKTAASTGWFNSSTGAPTVSFICSDAMSGLAGLCPAASTLGNGAGQSRSETIFDNAGNDSTASVSNVDVDLNAPSAPTASFDRSPEDSADGYFKDTVTVSYGGSTDVGPSGVAGYTGAQTFSASDSHNYSGEATDNAGNVSDATTGSVKVDATNPTFGACAGGPFTQGSGSGSQSVSISANDAHSGMDNADSTLNGTVNTSTIGDKTVSFAAKDNVGHQVTTQCSYSVIYNFAGYRAPVFNGGVFNGGVFNGAKSGSSIPMKFSLSGYQGLGIIAVGYPKVTKVVCPSSTSLVDQVEEYAATTTNTGLTYDSSIDQYNFVWKTQSAYAGKCYQFGMVLIDGTSHTALFKFIK